MTHFMSPKSSPNSNQVWEIPNSATVQQKDKYFYTFEIAGFYWHSSNFMLEDYSPV